MPVQSRLYHSICLKLGEKGSDGAGLRILQATRSVLRSRMKQHIGPRSPITQRAEKSPLSLQARRRTGRCPTDMGSLADPSGLLAKIRLSFTQQATGLQSLCSRVKILFFLTGVIGESLPSNYNIKRAFSRALAEDIHHFCFRMMAFGSPRAPWHGKLMASIGSR